MNSKDWLKTGAFSLTVGLVLIALAFVPPLYLLVVGLIIIVTASVLLARQVFDTGPLLYLLTSGVLASVISFVPLPYIVITGIGFLGLAFLFFFLAYRAPSPTPRPRRKKTLQPTVVLNVQQHQWIKNSAPGTVTGERQDSVRTNYGASRRRSSKVPVGLEPEEEGSG